MKLTLIFIMALVFMPLQSYAGSNSHDLYKQPFGGSSNKLFAPLDKSQQQALSAANPMENAGYNSKEIERVNWVTVNTAEIDALKSYAIEILGQAVNSTEFKTWDSNDARGHYIKVRPINALDFPLDINLNFFEDVQFNELYMGQVTKTTTDSGRVFYSLTLKRRNVFLPAIYVTLDDKLVIYAETRGGDIMLEQVNGFKFRVFQRKNVINHEGRQPLKRNKTNTHPDQKQIEKSPSSLHQAAVSASSATRYIDVLILFDNTTNQTLSRSALVSPGLDKINEVLSNSSINAEIRIAAFDNLPTSVCGGSSPCYKSYEDHLAEITDSKDILDLRLKYGADAAVVLRNTVNGDLNYQITGLANLTDPSDPLQANRTYAIVYSKARYKTFAHEVGHILGAGHSAYNSVPGSAPARGYLGFYDDKENAPYHKDAVETLMTYDYICQGELDNINANNPGKSLEECIEADQFSGPVQFSPPWTSSTVTIGSNTVANRYRVEDVSYRAEGWSKEIINHKPVPNINFVSVPGVAGLPHCFNGIGTTDPDGDDIIRFYWFVRPYADFTRLKEAEYATKESTFCWTPATSQLGDFRIHLSVRDARGEDKLLGVLFHVNSNPDYISAPELYLNQVNGYYITLSWSTPTVGNVSYYEVEKKGNDGIFTNEATSYDTTEIFSQYGLSSDNYFRVRGCTSSDKCGVWSNIIYYHQVINEINS